MRSAAACVAASFDDIIGNVIVAGVKYVVSETLSFAGLDM